MQSVFACREHSGSVLGSRTKGRGFEPHQRHCVVSLSKNINPSLVLVQPRKIRPFITERLLMGRKESNQTNKSLSKNFIPSLVLVKPRITCPYITERLLMGCKESNQTNKQTL